MNPKIHFKILLIFLVLLIFYHLFLYSIDKHDTIWNDLYGPISALIYLYGAIYGYTQAVRYKLGGHIAKAVYFFSSGALTYSIALFIWGYLVLFPFQDIELPYPSIADYFYLTFAILGTIGLLITLKIYNFHITKTKTLLSAVGLIASVLITGQLIGFPEFASDEGFSVSIMNNAYIFSDILVCWLAITTLIIARGRMTRVLQLVTLSFFTQFIGDMIYTKQINIDTFWDGSISDFFFSLSGMFISFTIIYIIKEFKPTNYV